MITPPGMKYILPKGKSGNLIVLFILSIFLLTMGIYGTTISNKYGCSNGVFIDLHNILTNSKNSGGSIVGKCINDNIKISANPTKKELDDYDFNDVDRCLNDKLNGQAVCMEGGLLTLSIISIILGSLMLLFVGYNAIY